MGIHDFTSLRYTPYNNNTTPPQLKNSKTNTTVKMQFTTIIAPFLALAAAASAQYNGTAPSGTAMGTASASGAGTGSNPTTSPIDNGANNLAGSALGLVIAGGVALAL